MHEFGFIIGMKLPFLVEYHIIWRSWHSMLPLNLIVKMKYYINWNNMVAFVIVNQQGNCLNL